MFGARSHKQLNFSGRNFGSCLTNTGEMCTWKCKGIVLSTIFRFFRWFRCYEESKTFLPFQPLITLLNLTSLDLCTQATETVDCGSGTNKVCTNGVCVCDLDNGYYLADDGTCVTSKTLNFNLKFLGSIFLVASISNITSTNV